MKTCKLILALLVYRVAAMPISGVECKPPTGGPPSKSMFGDGIGIPLMMLVMRGEIRLVVIVCMLTEDASPGVHRVRRQERVARDSMETTADWSAPSLATSPERAARVSGPQMIVVEPPNNAIMSLLKSPSL